MRVVVVCISGCHSKWRGFGDRCYYISDGERLNFEEAQEFCLNWTSSMVIVNNEEEQVDYY